jgi:lipopolysaccharide/colanic/teichoic acid biosynthesis glycosyltransferase
VRRLARPLYFAGIAVVVLGLGKAHAVANGYDLTESFRFTWALTYITVLAACAYGVGLPELGGTKQSVVLAAAASTAGAAGVMSVLQLLAGSALLPRFVVFASPAVLLPWSVLCADLARDGWARASRRDRVVVVAGLAAAAELTDELDADPERPALVAFVLEPEAAAQRPNGARPLIMAAEANDATAIVLDRSAQADDSIVAQAAELHEAGIRVRTLSLFYEQWLGKLPMAELERVSLMFDIGEVHRARYGRMKRILDLLTGAAGLVALTAVTPVVAMGNRFGNPGPLLYRQPRVGKNGRVFEILKFRTMRPGPATTEWTATDDPRVTPFGAWLRRTHLDEMPQVINILRGHLSVVGPRPEQPQYVETLETKLAFYRLRHLVRPGLTGWAQVKYDYGATDGDALEKLQYEFYYLRHQGLALDLRIIGRTLRSVVGGDGR